MHVVLGALTAIISILYILDRLGIDVGWWSPFHWRRRRAFAKRFGADPIYSVEDPIHLASLFVIGVAKLEGDLTAEQKQVAQEQFESSFRMEPREASELFGSAAHLLAAPQLIETQLNNLAEKNSGRFSGDQADSLLQMMTAVASAGGAPSATQQAFLDKARGLFPAQPSPQGTWS